MKKFLLLISFCTACLVQAQEDKRMSNDNNYSEIKLNGLMAVIGALDITYERTLNEESAFGLTFVVPYEDDTSLNYYLSPYYRIYFGEKYAAGFFVEGFGLLSSEDYLTDITLQNTNLVGITENALDFALGIGIGGKWLSKNGFVGELSFGIGRNLFNSDKTGSETVGKIGITLGYRF